MYSSMTMPWRTLVLSFVRVKLCGIINISIKLPERQFLEKLLIDTTDLGDSGPFADVEEC